MKKALILGVTGQDGSYLADVLLEKGYEVHGMVRRSATGNTRNIDHLINNPEVFNRSFFVQRGDLADPTSLYRIINEVEPREIYNEADQDHVSWSFDMVGYSSDITGAAVCRILETIKQVDPSIRFFQPCTSNMFGTAETEYQTEITTFNPQSPYACAKLFAHWITINFREAYGQFGCSGILFNHESPRRGETFVTRKVSLAVARIKLALQEKLRLGNLDAKRDWGYAKEYVEAMWRMLQQDEPDDFVIATGETHTVRELAEVAFDHVGLDWEKYTEVDPTYYRPAEVDMLLGDPGKAKRVLDWEPKTKFAELVRLMVDEDLQLLKAQQQ